MFTSFHKFLNRPCYNFFYRHFLNGSLDQKRLHQCLWDLNFHFQMIYLLHSHDGALILGHAGFLFLCQFFLCQFTKRIFTRHNAERASIVKRAVQCSDVIHYFYSASCLILNRTGISAHTQ